jgi:hypothetical protein
MAHVSDSEISFDDMSSTDIITVMKQAMTALQKKTKKMETCVVKAEEKKAKAAPAKGVRPPQLAQNAEWVNFVYQDMLVSGWTHEFLHASTLYSVSELITPKDAEGNDLVDEDGDVIMFHAFKGTNGQQPVLGHAMVLSKMYRTEKPEMYQEFLKTYVPAAVAAPAAAAAKPVVERAILTLAERREERARAEEEKEEEKAEKKRAREAKKAATALAKVEADAAKALLKGPKAPPKGAVIRAPVPVKAAMAGAVPVKAKPAVAVAVVAAPVPLKPLVKKLVKKPVVWVRPEKGQSNPFVYAGVTYLRDHLDRLFEIKDGEAGNCIGVFLENTKTVSQEDDDIPEDDDE